MSLDWLVKVAEPLIPYLYNGDENIYFFFSGKGNMIIYTKHLPQCLRHSKHSIIERNYPHYYLVLDC